MRIKWLVFLFLITLSVYSQSKKWENDLVVNYKMTDKNGKPQNSMEEEQRGKTKAAYGEQLLSELSVLLQREFGKGYSTTNLRWFRQFYFQYPVLIEIHHTVRDEFFQASIGHTLRDKSVTVSRESGRRRVNGNRGC